MKNQIKFAKGIVEAVVDKNKNAGINILLTPEDIKNFSTKKGYVPVSIRLGKDGKYYVSKEEYEELTAKPDQEGKMKEVEPGLDSIEDIIELLGPNKLKISELENAGYNVDAFPDNIKQLLINDIKKID